MALAVLFIIIGAICMVLFLARQITAPSPTPDQSFAGHGEFVGVGDGDVLPFSRPAKLVIPSINVESPIITTGKNKDGSMGVPSGADFDKAAWYKHSPAPGQAGWSIIQGHVDYYDKGPGVFFYLGSLKKGDKVMVHREDGKVATFTINKVKSYHKSQFPTDEVYGATEQPSLVLITCSGALDRQTGAYDHNTIAFGVLTTTK